MPLMDGCEDHIVSENISELRRGGMSEKQATHVALKKANKHRALDRAAKAVSKPSKDQVTIKKSY